MSPTNVLLIVFGLGVLVCAITAVVYAYVAFKTFRGGKHGVSTTWLVLLPIAAACAVGLVFTIMPPTADRSLNKMVLDAGAVAAVTPASAAFHRSLPSVDLHADSMWWTHRNLRNRDASVGHVDIPRLLEGSIALQCFSIVTKTPAGLNFKSNTNKTDVFGAVAVVQRWPVSTWTSLMERALFQAAYTKGVIESSDGKLVLVRTKGDLDSALERWTTEAAGAKGQQPPPPASFTSVLITIEGMHAVQGVMDNLDRLFDEGVRMMGIAHFFDNELGGSNTGEEKHGLTPLGREMVKRMEAKGIIVDVAHASDQVVLDVASMATKPFVVSHTGVQGTCELDRNLSDELLVAVARAGGVVGIGFFKKVLCGTTVAHVVAAIQHAVKVAGIDHVALGSDFDGTVTTPFDTSHMAAVTHALLEAGMTKEDVAAVVSGNALRVMRACLPDP